MSGWDLWLAGRFCSIDFSPVRQILIGKLPVRLSDSMLYWTEIINRDGGDP